MIKLACSDDDDDTTLLGEYPYGLQITLCEEVLEKLALKTLPEIGEEMILKARVCVTSVGQFEQAGQKPQRSISLQMTEMEIAQSSNAAEKLYGE